MAPYIRGASDWLLARGFVITAREKTCSTKGYVRKYKYWHKSKSSKLRRKKQPKQYDCVMPATIRNVYDWGRRSYALAARRYGDSGARYKYNDLWCWHLLVKSERLLRLLFLSASAIQKRSRLHTPQQRPAGLALTTCLWRNFHEMS